MDWKENRRTDLDYGTILHQGDPISDVERLVEVVRDEDDRLIGFHRFGLAANGAGSVIGQFPPAHRAAAFGNDFQGRILGKLDINLLQQLCGGHIKQGHRLGDMRRGEGTLALQLALRMTEFHNPVSWLYYIRTA